MFLRLPTQPSSRTDGLLALAAARCGYRQDVFAACLLLVGVVTGWLFSLFIGLRTDLPVSASLNTFLGGVAASIGSWTLGSYPGLYERTEDWLVLDGLHPWELRLCG